MRLAVISDIHGNLAALDAVVADVERVAPDLVVVGGDLVANGSSNADVVDRVRELGWLAVYGNTDEMLWNRNPLRDLAERLPGMAAMWSAIEDIRAFTLEQLSDAQLEYLRGLPDSWSREGLRVVHASPGNAWAAPAQSASDSELADAYRSSSEYTIVFGHLHTPFVRAVGDRTFANAGAVSLSYDGDTRAAYALVDDGVRSIRRVPYEVEVECRRLAHCRHPHAAWIGETLRKGRFVPFG